LKLASELEHEQNQQRALLKMGADGEGMCRRDMDCPTQHPTVPTAVSRITHGTIHQAEGGLGKITRYADGRPTRFTFQQPFTDVPQVQVTPDFGANPYTAFRQFWLYFLSKEDGAVDSEGFSLGDFCDVGFTVFFRWTESYIAPAGDSEEIALLDFERRVLNTLLTGINAIRDSLLKNTMNSTRKSGRCRI
jgi:hypothetical protein